MACSYHDDFFFIEPDNASTAAKLVARQRQYIIADGSAKLAGADYIEDILEHMGAMEV